MIFPIVRLYLTLSCHALLSTGLTLFFDLYTQLCLSQLKGIRLWSRTLMGKQSCRAMLFSKPLCWGLLQWLWCMQHPPHQCIHTNEPQMPGPAVAAAAAAFSALRPAVFQVSITTLKTSLINTLPGQGSEDREWALFSTDNSWIIIHAIVATRNP